MKSFYVLVFLILISLSSSTQVSAQRDSIGNSIGLIVLNKSHSRDRYIEFFNDDGSLWYRFSFYYDDSDGKFDYANNEFRPFAFHPDYFVLALKCIKKDSSGYQVIVNEEKRLLKYMRVGDTTISFEGWKTHLLNAFSVDFDSHRNQPRLRPHGPVINVDARDRIFRPVRIKGDWLKVKWRSLGRKKYLYSWIRWRRAESLLVELFYFS